MHIPKLNRTNILSGITLCLLLSHSPVAHPFKYYFDPAVDGGSPSLYIAPEESFTDSNPTLRLTGYILDSTEIITLVKEISSNDSLRIYLPDRGKADILGIRMEFTGPDSTINITGWRAYYQPDKKLVDYKGPDKLKRPADFKKYWSRTKKKLASIPLNPEITEIKEKETPTGRLYKIKLDSYENTPIVCWYFIPKEINLLSGESITRKYPAIQIMPGWGAEEPPIDRTTDGFITLSMNPRAHGPSKDYFYVESHHLWNIDNPEKYYYRAAYMDCLRGIDFLYSRPEVDQKKIGVEGGSQGGAFSLAVAALDHRIACAVSNVTYISNFPDFIKLATHGSGPDFGQLMQDPVKGRLIQKTLSYIDVANLSPWIKCPVQVCIGLQDRVCPPSNGIVALNRIPHNIPRQLIMDPMADHEITSIMRKANMAWFKKYLQSHPE